MRVIIFLLCFVFVITAVSAQNAGKGKISGTVTDASNKSPVDYATISLFKQGEASPFNGISTDPKGNFVISGVAPGDYKLTVDFIGYTQKVIAHVIVGNANTDLGNILLSPVQNQLKTVTITGKAPTVENKIDMMVYNPQNDLTVQGGVALDVLKKVPQISVDIDGNVELQGNSNIRFLINGKPSSIFGASLADALQTIPASQIKDIEVITNPGAKYDAEGTGGIINIVLKDSKVEGVNGSVNLTAGTRLNNGSFNLNARKGNFGVNAFFSGNEQLNSTTLNTVNRTSTAGDTITRLQENGSSAFKRSGYQSGISFDWNISKKDELTASFNFNHFGNSSTGFTNEHQQTYLPDSNIYSLNNFNSRLSANSTDISLAYKKTFAKKDQELDFLVNSSLGKNNSDFSQVLNYLTPGYEPSGQISTDPGTDRETDISVDYTQPFAKGFTLETGAKATIEDISNSVVTDTLLNDGDYINNPKQTYAFSYDRNIFAYYLSGLFSLFNNFLDGKAGLRYEYTTTTDDFPDANIPDYGILAPSFVLQHKLDETESIKFSYSYRLQRPNYSSLNPFYNISDTHNISTGNPDLKAELGHNYELAYNKSFDKGTNIYITAFYRYNTNDIQSFTNYYSELSIDGVEYSDVSLTQTSNIGSETNEGLNFYISVPVTGKFSLRSNMMLADRISANPGDPTVSGLAYRANLNASYEFANNLAAEVFGAYRSSQKTIQGTNPGFAFYNIAVRKEFWNKKASIGLTAANPFNRYVSQTATLSGGNFDQTNVREVPFRSFGISLSYKFGKLQFKKEEDKQQEENNPNMPPETKSEGTK